MIALPYMMTLYWCIAHDIDCVIHANNMQFMLSSQIYNRSMSPQNHKERYSAPVRRSRTRRSWIEATYVAVVVDVVLRKPIAVFVRAAIYTLRDTARAPENIYGVKGRYRH